MISTQFLAVRNAQKPRWFLCAAISYSFLLFLPVLDKLPLISRVKCHIILKCRGIFWHFCQSLVLSRRNLLLRDRAIYFYPSGTGGHPLLRGGQVSGQSPFRRKKKERKHYEETTVMPVSDPCAAGECAAPDSSRRSGSQAGKKQSHCHCIRQLRLHVH